MDASDGLLLGTDVLPGCNRDLSSKRRVGSFLYLLACNQSKMYDMTKGTTLFHLT